MTPAQEIAHQIHSISELARVHVGKYAAVTYSDALEQFQVWFNDKVVARGTYDAVVEQITSAKKGGTGR